MIMADKRYAPVKKFLHEAFLAEKQQYPLDVLAIKRFMADVIGAYAGKPKIAAAAAAAKVGFSQQTRHRVCVPPEEDVSCVLCMWNTA